MLRFSVENPFTNGQKPIFVYADPAGEVRGAGYGEPCVQILADVQSVRTSMENRAAKQALNAAQSFKMRAREGKPDFVILRALMEQYNTNYHVSTLMKQDDFELDRAFDFVRVMITSDASGIVKEEVNIMISLKTTADHLTRKGVQALVDNIRKSERASIRRLYQSASSRGPNVFADDEENQMKTEKLRRLREHGDGDSDQHSESGAGCFFSLRPLSSGGKAETNARNSRTLSGEPEQACSWNARSSSGDPREAEPSDDSDSMSEL